MSAKIHPSVGLAARVIVGAVLVYAGAAKAAGPAEEFAIVIGSYDLLPRDMVLTAATFLPWVEILIGWALIFGLKLRAAAISAGAMFAAFLLALASVQLKGIQLPNCGCFGDAIHFTPLQAFLFDACMSALCWLSWKSAPSPLSLDSWVEGGYTGTTHGKR
ncbi:MAG: DoxX family protein [Elusimicrobia bacterium CG11_big_fil_rev_8_21_14_0_20_64_6]|nr:MAG: DoxX family protein [Elusimicrobia bacterium CG11_big_fil_rev_8_21_14_0_20_64_6]